MMRYKHELVFTYVYLVQAWASHLVILTIKNIPRDGGWFRKRTKGSQVFWEFCTVQRIWFKAGVKMHLWLVSGLFQVLPLRPRRSADGKLEP